jgi:hypothetical protein
LLVLVAKATAELALLLLVARGALALLFAVAPGRLEGNFAYQLCRRGTWPALWLARRLAPRFVPDRHLPVLAGGLLLSAWLLLAAGKAVLCAEATGRAACTLAPGGPVAAAATRR